MEEVKTHLGHDGIEYKLISTRNSKYCYDCAFYDKTSKNGEIKSCIRVEILPEVLCRDKIFKKACEEFDTNFDTKIESTSEIKSNVETVKESFNKNILL